MPLGHHAGQEVMDSAAQNGPEHNPKVDHRSPARARQRAVNGTQTRDVQQLDQINSPCLHGNKVHPVRMGHCGGLPVVHAEYFFHQLAVGEKAHDQQDQASKKCDHRVPSFFSGSFHKKPVPTHKKRLPKAFILSLFAFPAFNYRHMKVEVK